MEKIVVMKIPHELCHTRRGYAHFLVGFTQSPTYSINVHIMSRNVAIAEKI